MTKYQLIHRQLLGKNIKHLSFSHDDKMVLSAGEEVYIGTIGGEALFHEKLRQVYKKYYYNLIPKHIRYITIYDSKWTRDNKFVLCATADGLYRFSIEDKKFENVFDTENALKCIDIDYEKEQIVVAENPERQRGSIFILDFQGNLISEIEHHHKRQLASLLFLENDMILSACTSNTIKIWNAKDGSLLHETIPEEGDLTDVSRFVDGDLLIKFRYGVGIYQTNADGSVTKKENIGEKLLDKSNKHFLAFNSKDNIAFIRDYTYQNMAIRDLEGQIVYKLPMGAQVQDLYLGLTKDIFAVTHRFNNPAEVHFYSTKDKNQYIDQEGIIKGWQVEKTFPKVKILQLLESYRNQPGHWIGVETKGFVIYNDQFEEVKKIASKNQIQRAVFHEQSQKVLFQMYKNLYITDLSNMGIDDLKPETVYNKRVENPNAIDFCWSVNAEKLAVITNDRQVTVFDSNLNIVTSFEGFEHRLKSIDFGPEKDRFAVGGEKGGVYICTISSKDVQTLETVSIDTVSDLIWNNDWNEIIVGSHEFINIFNSDSYALRKLDLERDCPISKISCRPSTKQFAVHIEDFREGHDIYIIDREKPIKECVLQKIRYHTGILDLIKWDGKDTLVSIGHESRLVFWEYSE